MARSEQTVPFGCECFESDRVDLLTVRHEFVSVASGADELGCAGRAIRLKRATEPRHVRAERPLRRPWRVLSPQLVDQIVRRNDVTCVNDQEGEDRAFLRSVDL